MTEPTLRELCERVIEAWDERISLDGGTKAHWNAWHNACRALGERLRVDARSVNKQTAEISTLEYEEQRRVKAFVRLGWVELVDHPTHRPGKVVVLTAKGRAILWARACERLPADAENGREE